MVQCINTTTTSFFNIKLAASARITLLVCYPSSDCYKSSGRTGCGKGTMDSLSRSRLRAFLMSVRTT